MESLPLISIIVPVYNVETYLNECVQSIINQTYRNIEVILIDDGSTDNCPAICDAFAVQDTRVRVIHKENGGQSTARNVGLKVARGEFIGFVDSDDFIAPEMFETLINGFSGHQEIGVCACGISHITEGGVLQPYIIENWHDGQIICSTELLLDLILYTKGFPWNKLYRRSAIGLLTFRKGCYPEDQMFSIELAIQMWATGMGMMEMPYTALYYYRQHINSTTHTKRQMILQGTFENWETLEKIAIEIRIPSIALFAIRKRKAQALLMVANEAPNNKNWREYLKRLNFWDVLFCASKHHKIALIVIKYFTLLWKYKIIRAKLMYNDYFNK